jgi:hypothetical protein
MSGGSPTVAVGRTPWVEVLASLAAHRVLTSAQVRAIHLPEAGLRRAQALLADLRREGLAAAAPGLRAQRVWFVTAAGLEVVRAAGALEREPPLLDERSAAGRLMAHTLAVNDVGIAFMRAARMRGEEFGALSWRHEVAHPLQASRRRGRPVLVTDAVLTYLREEDEGTVLEQRFCEVDRATRSIEGLARWLAGYVRLRRVADAGGESLWRQAYPAFPSVICVLGGAEMKLLHRRRDRVGALLRANPEVARSPHPSIRICLLEELCERGPYAPIFREARTEGGAVDWLGRAEGEA